MKHILYILLFFVSSVLQANERLTIAKVMASKGQNYSLIQIVDEDGGALLVELEENDTTTVLGGDSTVFPLSKFGVPNSIAKKIVEKFVAYEIENTKGGVKALQSRLQKRDSLPNDLLAEYSKFMTLSAKPFYIKSNVTLKEVTRVLLELQKTSPEKLSEFVLKELRPVRGELLESILNLDNDQILDLVIKSAVKFPDDQEVQLSLGVYVGQQPDSFRKKFLKLSATQKASVKEAINGAITSNVIGTKVKEVAFQTLKSL
ncbi:MAG: hypothetical protein KC646_16625 [Candidatus Cloacimonetes bacterium]|nr:hypothetical protein [Candidatus Cloacimonadota bacterium]